jgi:hypothetical protein
MQAVRRVTIISTDMPMDQALAKVNDEAEAHRLELNRGFSGLVFLGGLGYGPDDIAMAGKDVTTEFIKEAPSQLGAEGLLSRILSNPWLVGVGATVIAAGITAWLKWN